MSKQSFVLAVSWMVALTTSNLFAPAASNAGELQISNESTKKIYVAVAYHWHFIPSENGDHDRVNGFIKIAPGQTQTVASYPFQDGYGNTRLSEAWLHINVAGRIWRPSGRDVMVMDRSSLKQMGNSQGTWWIVRPELAGNQQRRFNIDPRSPIFDALKRDDPVVFYKTSLSGGAVKTFRFR